MLKSLLNKILLKRASNTGFLRTPFFYRTPPVATSDITAIKFLVRNTFTNKLILLVIFKNLNPGLFYNWSGKNWQKLPKAPVTEPFLRQVSSYRAATFPKKYTTFKSVLFSCEFCGTFQILRNVYSVEHIRIWINETIQQQKFISRLILLRLVYYY